MELLDVLISLVLGLGLSAACGFRIFVPLTIMSLAAKAEYLDLASGFEWIGSTPATVVFVSATLLEIGAYYIPWIDNLLDFLAAPTAVVAGTLVTASQIGDMNPVLTWTLAVIGGGGAAGVVQVLTTAARQISSFATAGFGNPVVSTLEAGASITMTVLTILMPLVVVPAVLLGMLWLAKKVFSRRKAQDTEAQSEAPA